MKKGLKVLVAIAILSCVLGALVFVMLPRGSKSEITGIVSVPELRDRLPNLSGYQILACEYTHRTETESGFPVPAPSDTMLELSGTMTLSPESESSLRSDFMWVETPHSKLPRVAQSIVPKDVRVLVSEGFHETFSRNPFFWHACIAMPVEPGSGAVYFVIRDGDHPVK